MDKRGNLILFGIAFLFLINLAYAENLNMKITGTINGYSSDVWLKTNSASSSGFDAYDFEKRTNPDNYSAFYSTATSDGLAIDSWKTNPRTINLVYQISEAQTGSMTFSWALLTGSYDGVFTYYGDDSTYTNAVASFNMRTSSSYTASISGSANVYAKVSVLDYTAPATETSSSSGGGGGGGGGDETKPKVSVDVSDLNLQIVVNSNKARSIKITNSEKSKKTIRIIPSSNNLIIAKQSSITLAPGESQEVEFVFVAPEKPGLYTGKILVGDKEIPVSVNVATKELLFDAMVVVPDSSKTLSFGDKLDAQVTLIPMGEDPRVDVTINYLIKDFSGKTFLEESETILITEQKSFKKEFSTLGLPTGNYVVGVEVVYPNGVAVSSSNFAVVEKKPMQKNLLLIIVLGAVIIAIAAVIIAFVFYRRRMNKKIKRMHAR